MATFQPNSPTWQDSPSTTTPITAARLNHIEAGIQAFSLQVMGSVVYVEDYGAVGNGTTDDTAAINSAIAAAVSAASSSGSSYAEVRFQAKTYAVNGSLTQGGTGKTNALIPLPMISGTADKVTLALIGAGAGTGLPLGTQTTGQTAGTVLATTVTGTNDATYGEASLIGGPTDQQGGGYNGGSPLFTNLLFVMDGIQLLLPNDPHICGLDLRGVAEVNIGRLFILPNVGVASISLPTQAWQFGLAMPEARNNALCRVAVYGAYGQNHGIRSSEHTSVEWCSIILCLVGIVVGHASGPHHSRFGYAAVELCQIAVAAIGADSYGYITIDLLDWEYSTGSFNANFPIISLIEDSNYLSNFGTRSVFNKLQGQITVNANGDPLYNYGPGPAGAGSDRVIGGGYLRVYCANVGSGDPTKTYNLHQPTLPASGTALKNPYYRDAAVSVTGATGTITAIKVDGVTTGITDGIVIVPSGRSIEVDYTAAPTWLWTIL